MLKSRENQLQWMYNVQVSENELSVCCGSNANSKQKSKYKYKVEPKKLGEPIMGVHVSENE